MSDIRSMSWGSFIHEPSEQVWNRRIRTALLVGVVLRLLMAFVVVPEMQQMGDGPAYVRQAHQLIDGTLDHFYFPPGTALTSIPVFAALGFTTVTEHLVGVLISIGFLLTVTWLARSMRLHRNAVFIATATAAVYPHVVLSSAQISSLPLAAVAVGMALGCTLRASRAPSLSLWTGAAFFCGLAVLTRPGTLLLAPVLLIWAAMAGRSRGESIRPLLPAVTVMVIVLGAMSLPVLSFHAGRGHGWTLATNSEWNLLLANNQYTPEYKTGHFGQRAIADLDPEVQSFFRQFFQTETAETASLRQRTIMLDSARTFMVAHPGKTAVRMSNRLRGFFGCDYTAARELQLVFGYSDAVFGVMMLAEGGLFIVLLAGWLVYLMVRPSTRAQERWMHLLLLAAIVAPHILAFALAKYHLPLVPIMICAAAAVISELSSGSDQTRATFTKRRNTLIIMGIVIVLVQVEHLYHLMLLR